MQPRIPPVSAIADVLALAGLDGWLTPPLVPIVGAGRRSVGRQSRWGSVLATRDLASAPCTGSSRPLPGAVLVLAGGGDVTGAVWGEIMSRAAAAQGAVAVLVDGAVRDRPAMGEEGLPVYGTREAVVGPAGSGHVLAEGEPVEIGGVRVEPGDAVVVDETGAVRIPAAWAERVLEAAALYADGEERVKEALARGERLIDAYRHKRNAAETVRRALTD